jgi:hypothetical protein
VGFARQAKIPASLGVSVLRQEILHGKPCIGREEV